MAWGKLALCPVGDAPRDGAGDPPDLEQVPRSEDAPHPCKADHVPFCAVGVDPLPGNGYESGEAAACRHVLPRIMEYSQVL